MATTKGISSFHEYSNDASGINNVFSVQLYPSRDARSGDEVSLFY